MKKKVFITGSSGFIGFHTAKKFLDRGFKVHGFDSMNNYYDVSLKRSRLNILKKYRYFSFTKNSIENEKKLNDSIKKFKPFVIIHLAAQAGVRYSIEKPRVYLDSNITGTYNIIELAKKVNVKHLLIASSSSVYGANKKLPFKESDGVDHPVSIYAATKKANELMAHTYSHLFGLPCTGLRFFTVYGPWGRPDMAPMIFTKAILEKKPIKIFNHGKMSRDFTYIDDVSETIFRLMSKPASSNDNFQKDNPNPSISWAPYRIFNIGNSNKVPLMKFINCLEKSLGVNAIKHFEELQAGDVKSTEANTDPIEDWTGFKPNTPIDEGVEKFVIWFKKYYRY